MEKGYRYLGTDLTGLDTPYEAGLGFCVRLEKGEFNGRTALLRSRERGLERRIRTLVVGGPEYRPVYGGEAVLSEGDVIGRIRSCAFGFTVGRNVASAYLHTGVEGGAGVGVEVFGELIPAEVVADVLYDPGRERILA